MRAYIMERERFDGADIAHILQSCAEKLDWPHLVQRFGPDWRVLLSHLVLFGYIYPSEHGRIPTAIMDDLILRLRKDAPTARCEHVCRGTLLSRKQYLVDVEEWGFRDARFGTTRPYGCEGHCTLDKSNRKRGEVAGQARVIRDSLQRVRI